jgi:hypothetical protein
MKNRAKLILIISLLAGVAVISCKRIDEYPIEPEIKYIDFEKLYNTTDSIYDRGVLKFSYTDGDGDLGLAKRDTFPPYNPGSKYYYNLLIYYYEIQNGVETPVALGYWDPVNQTLDTVSLSARIPLLTVPGADRPISGDIYDTLFIYNYNSPYDTVFLEFQIVDRALHESNLERTDYIVRR